MANLVTKASELIYQMDSDQLREVADAIQLKRQYLAKQAIKNFIVGDMVQFTSTRTGGAVNGVLVPAGTTSVYDQVLGKNAKRPFLHVRYRASEAEDRRYKTWMTGSAGGAMSSDIDKMQVNFLSERALCVMGANNFVLFKG